MLSTWPANVSCASQVVDHGATYCYLQGTSMAGPHVSRRRGLDHEHTGKSEGGPGGLGEAPTRCRVRTDCDLRAFPQFSGEPQECTGGMGTTASTARVRSTPWSAVD